MKKIRSTNGTHCQMKDGSYRYFKPGSAIPEYDLGNGFSAVRFRGGNYRGPYKWTWGNGFANTGSLAPTLNACQKAVAAHLKANPKDASAAADFMRQLEAFFPA